MKSVVVWIALIWLGLHLVCRLDEAINDTPGTAPAQGQQAADHADPILFMTVLLGGLGYFLTRQIRAEEQTIRPRKSPWITAAWTPLLVRVVWDSGIGCVLLFGWGMQVGIFVKALALPGWSGRPVLIGCLGIVLLDYAALTLVWGLHYRRICALRGSPGRTKPARPAQLWERDLDQEFLSGSRPLA